MAKYDLPGSLRAFDEIWAPECNTLTIPTGYCTPGLWVTAVALAKEKNLELDDICFPNKKLEEYSSALGLSLVLTGHDDYPNERINNGCNYSTIQLLDDEDASETAMANVNGCIRRMIKETSTPGIVDLCNVIGELHNNVWAHGRSTGFSCAQKYADFSIGGEKVIEFALADRGFGFMREMRRVGKEVATDCEAIKWCIEEGHSTKLADKKDEFAQTVRADNIGGSPFGKGVNTKTEIVVNHQGLGLFKLISLVKKYGGKLAIASGNCLFQVDRMGNTSYSEIKEWKGVAISCTLNARRLQEKTTDKKKNPEVVSIMDQLRG